MTTLAALLRGNPNYRYTWMAQVVSEIGDYFNNIAVFALVMEKSSSGLVVSGVMLSRAIPAVLAGPVAGVLLDRLDRKRIMIASDLIRAAVADLAEACLGILDTRHHLRHAGSVRKREHHRSVGDWVDDATQTQIFTDGHCYLSWGVVWTP